VLDSSNDADSHKGVPFVALVIPLPTRSSGGRYSIFQQKFLSKLILGIGRENEYPKLVSKFWGLPKKIEGVKVYKFRYSNWPCSGVNGHTHFNFYKW